jgi:galactokinase
MAGMGARTLASRIVEVVAHGPGRVNLIGEHTDYNDGLCLAFAIERGVTVRAEATFDGRVFAHSSSLGEDDLFAADNPTPPGHGDWRAFVRGMVAELRAEGLSLPGARLRIDSDLPQGAGLASSAALSSALALALIALGQVRLDDPLDLARLCARVEHDWVGARTGLLDQLTALCGREGHALALDLRALSLQPVPLWFGDWRLVTLDSGARHANAASGYNERRAECAQAAQLLGRESLRDATLQDAARLPAPLSARVRHVVTENTRVRDTVAALRAGDLAQVGRLLDASHASLRDDYEVSVPEVDETVALLRGVGAAGARMMGGGFGGSVLALLPPGVRPPARSLTVTPAGAAHLE